MSKKWYDLNWKLKETNAFNAFWLDFYGDVEEYQDMDDYWIRKAFALAGWHGKELDK